MNKSKSYNTSRDYKHLKELLDNGAIVIGFTTYDFDRLNKDKNHKPIMTTKDIEILTVTVKMKDGTVAVSAVKPELYNIIVGLCEFVRVDKEKISEVTIKDITKEK